MYVLKLNPFRQTSLVAAPHLVILFECPTIHYVYKMPLYAKNSPTFKRAPENTSDRVSGTRNQTKYTGLRSYSGLLTHTDLFLCLRRS